jgi:hypothetical protein
MEVFVVSMERCKREIYNLVCDILSLVKRIQNLPLYLHQICKLEASYVNESGEIVVLKNDMNRVNEIIIEKLLQESEYWMQMFKDFSTMCESMLNLDSLSELLLVKQPTNKTLRELCSCWLEQMSFDAVWETAKKARKEIKHDLLVRWVKQALH